MDCDDTAFWEARKASLAAQIVAYEAALLAFASDNTQSYTLDTNQTRQTVQRAEIGSLRNTYETLLGLYDTVCARLGCSSVIVVPVK
jgi:hypothetical protein